MYELVQITETSYYIECPSKIGLVRVSEQDVCLIDSGNDKEAGRKIRKILDAHGWRLTTIYNTHSHADHIGGNKYLQGQTGCKIYAPKIHATFACYALLEASFLYGACPPKELRNKFLMASESQVEELEAHVLPDMIKALPLPGHFFDMVGYRTADDVVFLADCLLSQNILDKYKIGVMYDVAAYLATLEYVKTLEARAFVPSHAPMTEDIVPLAQYNIDKVYEVAEDVCSLCEVPIHFEALLRKIFIKYQLNMNFDQYVLVGSSVRALLTWLQSFERINIVFEDNMLLWQRHS